MSNDLNSVTNITPSANPKSATDITPDVTADPDTDITLDVITDPDTNSTPAQHCQTVTGDFLTENDDFIH